MATPCLHRFCSSCIEKCLRIGKQECPSCRQPVATRRSLRKDTNFAMLVATLYPDLTQLEAEETEMIEQLSRSHRERHAEKMRELRAARLKQQRMAGCHTSSFQEVEPSEAKDSKSEGDGSDAESDDSASEREPDGDEPPAEEGEEGEEEVEEGDGKEVGAECHTRAGRHEAAASGMRQPNARAAGGSRRRSESGTGSRGGGRRNVVRRRAAKHLELKPRKHELGFWLRRHPREHTLAAITKEYITTSRDASIGHVQKFLCCKLHDAVGWQQIELSVTKPSGERVLLKPHMTILEVVLECALDTKAMLLDYRKCA